MTINIHVDNLYCLNLNYNVSLSWPRDERKIQVVLGPLILVIYELINEAITDKIEFGYQN